MKTEKKIKQVRNQYIILILAMVFVMNNVSAQKQLLLTKGSYLVLRGNVALVTNNAAINNNGTIVPGIATFYFTGNSDTALSYVTGTSITTCTNLTVNKSSYGVAIKSSVHVTNVLKMMAGNLYPDSALTLISDSNNTARLASVPATCFINGKTIVQRYIPAHRAWRLLTAPVTSSNNIYNAWQNGGVYTPGIGTLITVPSPVTGDGMDAGINSNYSMKAFNQNTQSLVNVINTKSNNISPTNNGSADNAGYFIFVRGDRTAATVGNPNLTALPLINTTLSSAGNLQTQTQTFAAAQVAGQYSLIGNPYASPVDFNNVSRSNVIKRFYVWDPTLNVVGGYVALDDITNSGTFSKSVAASKQTNEIQSGQAFFVQTLSTGAASVTFNENSKSTTSNTRVFRPQNAVGSLVTNLYLLNQDSSTVLADGTLAEFDDQFDSAVNWQDANKISNVNEAISLLRDNKSLAIERRPVIASNDTLFLKVANQTARSYQLELIASNIAQPNLTGILKDNYLGTSTPLNMNGAATLVNYNVVSGDAASAASNRFMIVFNNTSPLPVTFINVSASKVDAGINVKWTVTNEVNIKAYDIERSIDGKNFNKIGNTKAINNNLSSITYNWLDENHQNGNSYYRIKSIAADGSFQYSQVVEVVKNTTTDNISVYPTLVVDKLINIEFNNQPSGVYKINLFTVSGQMIYSKEITVAGSNYTQSIMLPASLAKGTYEVNITKEGSAAITEKIIIQ